MLERRTRRFCRSPHSLTRMYLPSCTRNDDDDDDDDDDDCRRLALRRALPTLRHFQPGMPGV